MNTFGLGKTCGEVFVMLVFSLLFTRKLILILLNLLDKVNDFQVLVKVFQESYIYRDLVMRANKTIQTVFSRHYEALLAAVMILTR